MNLCCACRRDFSSVAAFDRHRVGRHAYDFAASSGLGIEDGRRCLNEDEMLEVGLSLDPRGRWCIIADVERARELRIRSETSSEGLGGVLA